MEFGRWGGQPARPRVARGCDVCAGSGFKGRRGIYELFLPDDATRADIVAGAAADLLRAKSRQRGASSLHDEGWRLVRDGVTTPEELVRALGEVEG